MRERLLNAVARAGTESPRRVLATAVILTLAAACVLPFLRVDAGHSGLFDPNHPVLVRDQAFNARYGSPNRLILLVEGGSEPLRRQVIDRLGERLPAPPDGRTDTCDEDDPPNAPGCAGGVLGHLDLDAVAGSGLLYLETAQLERLVETLEGDALGVAALSDLTGIAGLLEVLTEMVETQADDGLPEGDDAREAAEEAMGFLARFLDTLRGRVSSQTAAPGGDAERPLLGEVFQRTGGGGMDAEGYLSSDDGALKLAVVQPVVETDDPVYLRPFVRYCQRQAEAILEEVGAACAGGCPDGPLRLTTTGLPAILADEADAITRSAAMTGVVATIGLFLALFIGYRSLPQAVAVLLPVLFSLIWSLAFTQIAFGGLNMVTAAVVPILLGLTVDATVHFLSRYHEARRSGLEPAPAIVATHRAVGPGLLTGTLTTAGAFGALTITDFDAFQQMGAITGFGILVGLTVTMLVIPSLITQLPVLQGAPDFADDALARGLARLPSLLVRRAGLVLGIAVVGAVASLSTSTPVPWNYDYFELLPQEAESRLALIRLAEETDFSGEVVGVHTASAADAERVADALEALPLVARVETAPRYLPGPIPDQQARIALLRRLREPLSATGPAPSPTAIDGAELAEAAEALGDALEDARFSAVRANADEAAMLDAPLKAARELTEALEGAPAAQVGPRLARVQGDLLDGRDRALKLLRDHLDAEPITLETLLARLPPAMRARLSDGEGYAVYAYPARPIRSEADFHAFVDQVTGVAPDAAGFPIRHYQTMQVIIAGYEQATRATFMALFILLLLDFRSIRYALLAMVPLAGGVAWAWAVLSWTRFEYNPGNVVALPLILGIAVDSGVHMLHRFRQHGEQDVEGVLAGTGRAVLLSGVTTLFGFGALLAAEYNAMRSFGVLLVIAMVSCLVGALVFLPALLHVVRRRR